MKKINGEHQFEVGVRDFRSDRGQMCYVVQLPHQCDEFLAAAQHSKAAAIAEMEGFIKQATAALEVLRTLPEHGQKRRDLWEVQ